MNDQAKISLNIHGMSVEIVGSEGFVSEQIGHFRDAIQAALAREEAKEEPLDASPGPPAAPHKKPTGESKYTNALHIDGTNVRILKNVLPGDKTTKRAVDTVLIYLWAKRNAGVDSVPFSELHNVGRDQGCLDTSNFAGTIKSARQWIIVEGTRRAEKAKLTTPGVEHAKKLLEKLNADGKGAQNS